MQGGGTSDSGGIWLGMGIWVLEKAMAMLGRRTSRSPEVNKAKVAEKLVLVPKVKRA